MATYNLYNESNLETMRRMPDNSIDAIVTDPPYGLSFMGKKWDYDVPSIETWQECLRVLKPGGHLLAFAGTRTQHRMAVRIEDAGFEIRDMIAWVYGSGFPKSHDISKAMDKKEGAERELVATIKKTPSASSNCNEGWARPWAEGKTTMDITAPATDAAKKWNGWGTALKPALEPITVARKPIEGTIADNVLRYGTGGINIDGCRVGFEERTYSGMSAKQPKGAGTFRDDSWILKEYSNTVQGRFPANFIHDGSEEVLNLFPQTNAARQSKRGADRNGLVYGRYNLNDTVRGHDDNGGSAARFFYCAKTSKGERNAGCEGMELRQYSHDGMEKPIENAFQRNNSKTLNHHPTVKPIALMRYLVRLVTPPNGTVYDPFMGSGTTIIAANQEGFNAVGSELEKEYFDIANKRVAHFAAQLRVF